MPYTFILTAWVICVLVAIALWLFKERSTAAELLVTATFSMLVAAVLAFAAERLSSEGFYGFLLFVLIVLGGAVGGAVIGYLVTKRFSER
jgi:hypothetical protein